jgi:hypothetical protein
MPRGSVTQKMQQVVTFLIGLRHRVIRQALAAHGLSAEEIERGWRLVMEVGDDGRFDAGPTSGPLIAELDAWENVWFPIAEATLSTRAPEVRAVVFKNLRQTSGVEVVVGVRTFLERIDALETGDAAQRTARRLLSERGLTSGKLREAHALIARIEEVELEPAAEDSSAEQEDAMWRWYKEWSAVARAVLSDRRHLNALGFQRARVGEQQK